MSNEKTVKAKSPKATKAKAPKAPKAKKAKAPAAPKAEATTPRGFGSDEAKKRLAMARASLAKAWPKMLAQDRDLYLMEVGANRYNALANYAK